MEAPQHEVVFYDFKSRTADLLLCIALLDHRQQARQEYHYSSNIRNVLSGVITESSGVFTDVGSGSGDGTGDGESIFFLFYYLFNSVNFLFHNDSDSL